MHDHIPEFLALSPNGQLLAAGNSSGDISLWDLAAGQRVANLVQSFGPRTLEFGPSGDLLAVRDGVTAAGEDGESQETGGLRVWEVPGGKESWSESGGRRSFVESIAFSRDGALMAAGGEQLRLLDTRTGELKWMRKERAFKDEDDRMRQRLPDGHIVSVAMSPDGTLVGSLSLEVEKSLVELFEVTSGKPRGKAEVEDGGTGKVGFSREKVLCVSEEDDGAGSVVLLRSWPIPRPE